MTWFQIDYSFPHSQRRNVNPLDFRVNNDFSTGITSLDDA